MKKYLVWSGMGLVATLALALSASAVSAQTIGVGLHAGVNMQGGFRGGPGPAQVPGIVGSVTAVNGTTLTVTSKMFQRGSATSTPASMTTYTVDASNATVYKDGATSTISSVNTGDMVFVQGTVSGTNITATMIRDGVMPGMMNGRGPGFGHGASSTKPSSSTKFSSSTFTFPFTGNGEPVIAGSVSAVSGNTLTVTNKSNVTYTVDVSSSTIIKNGTTTAIANIATGDNVVIQGTVNGTSVTASSVLDQGTGAKVGSPSSTPNRGPHPIVGGIFGAIGGFFKHLFGF